MTPEQTAELDKWAAQAGERQAIIDFLEQTAAIKIEWKTTRSLDTLLDEFFGIDRSLLESARRALLRDNTGPRRS